MGHNAVVCDCLFPLVEEAVCESQGAHRLLLVGEKPLVDSLFRGSVGKLAAERVYDFRRALYIQHTAAGGIADDGCHVFALGGEGKFLRDGASLFEGARVDACLVEPQQQRPLRGVAQGFGMGRV